MHTTVCHGTHSSDTALKNIGENTVPFVEVRTGVNHFVAFKNKHLKI
jgi:hypothetical protein